LFYTKPVDGTPICGEAFMGLRYRIDYTSHAVSAASRSLGGVGNAYSANLLYWGNQPQDPVFAEVNWQQQELSQWPQQVNIPQPTTNNAKIDLLNMLNKPAPSPMAVLYFYCHCSVGKGNTPVLRFGSTNDSTDVVGRIEIGTLAMADKPLIFANACSTATADAYMANELAEIFFRRGCRAFLGTETKVPVLFASRFAFLFFNFFYRKIDAAPMAGGEAVVQARLWCWTHYRNIGGLFYSYINQYELFMAEEAEVKALRR
jgi:hypothetical protein